MSPVLNTADALRLGGTSVDKVMLGATRVWPPEGGGDPWEGLTVLAHWDASDLGTITESDGAVSQVDDLSGHDAHLTQPSGASQPATGVHTINGLNVLTFDGDNDHLAATLSLASPWTMVTVVQAASLHFGSLISEDESQPTCDYWGLGNDGTIWAGVPDTNGLTYTTGVPLLCTLTVDGSDSIVSVNGTQETRDLAIGPWTSLWVGRSGWGDPFHGRWGEAAILDGALDPASDLSDLLQHFATKWGVTL